MSRKSVPIIGLQFGCLKVISEHENSNPKNKMFNTVCVMCDTHAAKLGGNIRNPIGPGCKCQSAARKHGLWRHPAYKTWEGMISRCYSENHDAYHRYGGRGIFVCEEWRPDPTKFIEWLLAAGWEKGKEIDRKDNDLGYSPGNCRVVERIVNANNRRNSRYLNIEGEKLTVAEAARKFGIGKTTIKERLNRGWTDSDSVSEVRV